MSDVGWLLLVKCFLLLPHMKLHQVACPGGVGKRHRKRCECSSPPPEVPSSCLGFSVVFGAGESTGVES